jgi:hypothetical protein
VLRCGHAVHVRQPDCITTQVRELKGDSPAMSDFC